MKLLIMNSLDERYGSTYRIRAFSKELSKFPYEIYYFEKKTSFILKFFEMSWTSIVKNFDVLIIQKFNPLTALPILISKVRGKYVIVDWDDWDTGLQKNIFLKILTWLCEKTLPYFPDLITSHNSNLLSMVPQKKQTLLLEQGFDPDLFQNKPKIKTKNGTIRVGYMCTFTHGGTLDLEDILVSLSKISNPNIEFIIIGGGDLLESFKNRASNLSIKNITFTGHIDHDQIPPTLQNLDVGLIYMKDSKANKSRVSFKVIEYLAADVPFILGQAIGETDRLFGRAISECPLEKLPIFLNQLQPEFRQKKKIWDDLLIPFTWTRILSKLNILLESLKITP